MVHFKKHETEQLTHFNVSKLLLICAKIYVRCAHTFL